MSAEKQTAPEQPKAPRPPKPEVTLENLTADNLTHFTPHSDKEEQAARDIENAPYRFRDNRKFSRAILTMPFHKYPERKPELPSEEFDNFTLSDNPTRAELKKLYRHELHDLVKQYIPEDAEYELGEGHDGLSDAELKKYQAYNAASLEKDLRKYRSITGSRSAWRKAVHTSVAEDQPAEQTEQAPDPEAAQEENLAEFRRYAVANLDTLLAEKQGVNELVKLLYPHTVAYNLDKFLAAGATNIDVNDLVKMSPTPVAEDPLKFINAGASVENVVSKIHSKATIEHFTELRRAGADADLLMTRFHLKHLSPEAAQQYIDRLIAAGADPSDLLKLQAIAKQQAPETPKPKTPTAKTPKATSTEAKKPEVKKAHEKPLSTAEKFARLAIDQAKKNK